MDTKRPRVVTSLEQVDRDWLNAILVRSGAIETGRIDYFQASAMTSTNAHILRLHLTYSSDASGSLPATLILKVCNGGELFVADSEVNYYNRDYLNLADAPIPRCHDAQFSSEGGSYHILMDDLTDTHVKDSEPSIEYGVEVARSLAAMHVHGWGEKRIKNLGEQIPNKQKIDRFSNHVQQGLAPLLEATKNKISEDWRTIISEVFERYPAKMLERTSDANGFAVLHGDLNPGNILSPKSGDGKVYFLDRQPFLWSLTTWLAVSDLAIMMVPYWPPAQRRKLEVSIIEEYYKQLLNHGITGYSWRHLMDDYRLSAIQSLYIAAEWCINEEERQRMHWLWWQELQNSMAVISELNCMELLG